jgi:hypothetical protein
MKKHPITGLQDNIAISLAATLAGNTKLSRRIINNWNESLFLKGLLLLISYYFQQ